MTKRSIAYSAGVAMALVVCLASAAMLLSTYVMSARNRNLTLQFDQAIGESDEIVVSLLDGGELGLAPTHINDNNAISNVRSLLNIASARPCKLNGKIAAKPLIRITAMRDGRELAAAELLGDIVFFKTSATSEVSYQLQTLDAYWHLCELGGMDLR